MMLISFMYAVMLGTVQFVKNFLTNNLSSVHYFTDGCAGQYKNLKKTSETCAITWKILEATWSFFATRHGKFPCNGILVKH